MAGGLQRRSLLMHTVLPALSHNSAVQRLVQEYVGACPCLANCVLVHQFGQLSRPVCFALCRLWLCILIAPALHKQSEALCWSLLELRAFTLAREHCTGECQLQ